MVSSSCVQSSTCDTVVAIIAAMSLRQILIRRAKLRFEFWSWGGKGEGGDYERATVPFVCWPKCLQFLLQGDGLRTKCSDWLKRGPCPFCFMKMVFFWYCTSAN